MIDSTVSLQHSRLARLGRLVRFEERGTLIGLIVIALLIGIPHPEFFRPAALIEVLRYASFVGTIGFGMVFLIAMGEIDLSVAGMFGLVSTFCAALIWLKGLNTWLAVLICLAAGVVMGTINGLVTNALRIPLLIVSLGLLPFYYGINLVLSSGYAITAVQDARMSNSFFTYVGGQLYGVPVTGWIAIACCIVLQVVFMKTRFGATVRAIGSNPAAARFIAIRVRRTRVYTTALVGLLSAIVGVESLAYYKNGVANVGLGMELRVIAAVVIGGTSLEGGSGTMIGAILGALIMSTIDSGIVFFGIDPNYSQLVIGLVIIAAIVMDWVFKRRRAR